MYSNIFVALDGSELAERVLPHAQALAEKLGAAVTLVRAVPVDMMIAPPAMMTVAGVMPVTGEFVDIEPVIEAHRQEATRYLQTVADRLKAQNLQVTTAQPEGRPAEVIVELAGHAGDSLIAMTTHGHTGLRRLVLGSVADEVLRTATCPVLLVRAAETRQP
jgi:nucleotide-binding universal stress UspA family protein